LQAVSNLLYAWVAIAGHNYKVMTMAIASDNICGGMGTTAFVALLMALCNKRFTATQFALLSALASIGRVYVGPLAGYLTDPTGAALSWPTFFVITFVSALPGVVMVWWMRGTIDALYARERPAPSANSLQPVLRSVELSKFPGASRRFSYAVGAPRRKFHNI
jgi:MFS transporter, PAT family, beta-lactamase induction signal transducer AmpG